MDISPNIAVFLQNKVEPIPAQIGSGVFQSPVALQTTVSDPAVCNKYPPLQTVDAVSPSVGSLSEIVTWPLSTVGIGHTENERARTMVIRA